MIYIKDVMFKYKDGFVLQMERFNVEPLTQIFINGPSGCGKTTFLNLLTGLLRPLQGQIKICGQDITALSPVESDQFRADHFGIIFQMFNLIPYLTVIENIVLPCTFSLVKKKKVLEEFGALEKGAEFFCNALDLNDGLLSKPVNHLSVGQQQRVAIARAMIGQPEIIIADEPTSALDCERKDQFMSLLQAMCKTYKMTLVFVSHDISLSSEFDSTHSLGHSPLKAKKSYVSV